MDERREAERNGDVAMTNEEAMALMCPVLMSGLASVAAQEAVVDGDESSQARADFYAQKGLCVADQCMAWSGAECSLFSRNRVVAGEIRVLS